MKKKNPVVSASAQQGSEGSPEWLQVWYYVEKVGGLSFQMLWSEACICCFANCNLYLVCVSLISKTMPFVSNDAPGYLKNCYSIYVKALSCQEPSTEPATTQNRKTKQNRYFEWHTVHWKEAEQRWKEGEWLSDSFPCLWLRCSRHESVCLRINKTSSGSSGFSPSISLHFAYTGTVSYIYPV